MHRVIATIQKKILKSVNRLMRYRKSPLGVMRECPKIEF